MTILFSAYSCLSAAAGAEGDTWLQWRGPERDGHFTGPAWPDRLQGRLVEQWSQPLAPGYSGPIVSTNLVVTFETKGKKEEIVRAFDRRTGEKKWRVAWPGAMSVPFFAAENGSWVRSTPATDGQTVYLAGMRDVLVALELATGEEKWRVDFPARHGTPVPTFGFVCSPLIDGDHLFVQAAAGVVKVNRATGATVWRSLEDGGGMNGSAFSSPVLATLAGVRQLVVQSRELLAGLDPESGAVLWKQPVESFRGMNILTPTVVGNRVFTSAYGGKTQAFEIGRSGDAWTVKESWSAKLQGYMSSPVRIGEHVFTHLRNERFACLRVADGTIRYISDKPVAKYLSMVWQGDRILALDTRGQLRLLRANPEKYEVIDTFAAATTPDTWAHLAVAGDQVFVRAIDRIHAWRWTTP